MDAIISWFDDYKWWFIGASAVMFIVSVAALPVVVVRLPHDYLTRRRRPHWKDSRYPPLKLAFLIGKNILGVVLLIAGAIMLVTPGQGVLAIVVSLILLDIPGKRKLLAKLAGQRRVLKALNGLRRKYGKPPLKVATE
jgi:hypothetical protein